MIDINWSDILDSIESYAPTMLLAFAVLIGCVVLASVVRKIILFFLNKTGIQKSVINLVGRLSHLLIVLVGALAALRVLDLDGVVTSVLAGAGIIGLALGFAFQDIASNFIAGIAIAVQKQFNIGDLIEVDEVFGIVKKIELRTTTIQTLQGQTVYVPNKDLFTAKMIDYTHLGRRRVDLSCGVSYGDDLEKVKKITLEAISSLKLIDDKQPVDFYYEEFGDSSINFTIRYWAKFKKETDYLDARSQGVIAIKKAFDKNDISIPFPIRTLDFEGVKGGSSLSGHLAKK